MTSTEVYATKEQFREHIEMPAATTKYDAAIDRLLQSASRVIDKFTQAKDGFIAPATATAREFTGKGLAWIRIHECVAISQVAVKQSATGTTYTAWAAADWIPFQGSTKNPEWNRTPYTGIMVTAGGNQSSFLNGRIGNRREWNPTVQVTARWGRYATTAEIPQVRDVTIMQAMRWFKRMQSEMADSLASGDFGTLTFMKDLDPDIAMILARGRLIRPSIA
jgi:hypothetical protein